MGTTNSSPAWEVARELPEEESGDDTGALEIFRVRCPDCDQPIALLVHEETLPEHALVSTRWDPFDLTVCPGTQRPVAETVQAEGELASLEQDAAVLLTLPESLDWRTQPFSHLGGPGSRPLRRSGDAAARNSAQRG